MLSPWEQIETKNNNHSASTKTSIWRKLVEECSCCNSPSTVNDMIDNPVLDEGALVKIPEMESDVTSEHFQKIQDAKNSKPLLNYNSHSSSGTPSLDAPAEFAGSWICTQVSGDMSAYLQDMGLTHDLCVAAECTNYGVGLQLQNITQIGDLFVIQNILTAPVTMRFQVGSGVQSVADQEGIPILINPTWDGKTLCVISSRRTGELISNSRRYIQEDNMILQLTSPKGVVVKRIFTRRADRHDFLAWQTNVQ